MATLPVLSAALVDLRASVDELDKLDDELGAMIQTVEDALRGLGLGVRIAVQMERGENWQKLLAFDRHGKGWRLLIEEGAEDGWGDRSVTALASAPRDDRSSVFERHLNSLLMSASGQIKGRIRERREAIEETKSIVGVLETAAKAKKG